MTGEVSSLPLQSFSFETVTLDERGEMVERRAGSALCFREELGEGVAIEMVAVPGGIFQMGSHHGEGYDDEQPRHWVSLAGFLIGRSPVTQAQWRRVTGEQRRVRFQGEDLPMENVSWREARDFCRKLSGRTRRRYSLPSEAQWEYACRAGTITPFHTGATITTDFANFSGLHTYRQEPEGVYRHTPTPGGTFPPNAFGLFDMHGNLWEYCADGWHPSYEGAPSGGSAWEFGGEQGCRAARGGSWHEPPGNCRSAVRLRIHETYREDLCGFRVLLAYPGSTP